MFSQLLQAGQGMINGMPRAQPIGGQQFGMGGQFGGMNPFQQQGQQVYPWMNQGGQGWTPMPSVPGAQKFPQELGGFGIQNPPDMPGQGFQQARPISQLFKGFPQQSNPNPGNWNNWWNQRLPQ